VFFIQSTDKPGSVVDDHLSSLPVAKQIKRLLACRRVTLLQTSLQSTGFTSQLRHHS